MKFEFIGNACGIFHGDKGTRILCDPWIENGIFEGSWCHYPPLKTKQKDLIDVDAIYISHLHQDHFDQRNFDFNLETPIFVLDRNPNYLIKILQNACFSNLICLKNAQSFVFKEFEITLYAPFATHIFYDAAIGNLLDSAMVIKNGDKIAFNANDNTPTVKSCKMLKQKFGHIDLAMINYNAAGPYPACFTNLSNLEVLEEREKILKRNYNHLINLIEELKPSFILPFAGSYVIGGKFHYKNKFLATGTWDQCADFIEAKISKDTNVICLRENDVFNLECGYADRPYVPIDENHMKNYIQNELSKIKYHYELIEYPDSKILLNDLKIASNKMLERLKKNKFEFNTSVSIIIDSDEIEIYSAIDKKCHIICELDTRLLRLILDRVSHWDNATIGCHIEFNRIPNIFEVDVPVGLSFLHL